MPNEDAGTLLSYLKKHKLPFKTIHLYKGESPPSGFSSIRALIVMGGPMNVYEEDKHPFLKKENAFIQVAVKRGIPYLGICLGSQLLAKALGFKVYKAKKPEVGWDSVTLSAYAKTDPLFSHLKKKTLHVLQWHEDTFDLPNGAARLASSKIVPNQAYRYKDRFYGFQFHLEVDKPMLKDWFKKSPILSETLKGYNAYKKELTVFTNKMYKSFFSLV